MSSVRLLGTAEQLNNTLQRWPESAGLTPNEFASAMGHLIAERIPPEGVSPEEFDKTLLEVLHDNWAARKQTTDEPVPEKLPDGDAHDYLMFSDIMIGVARVAFGPDFERRLKEIDRERGGGAIKRLLEITDEDLNPPYQPCAKEPEDQINEAALPVVRELWSNPNTRMEAMELVLGRRVDAEEILPSSPLYSQLGIIYRMDDPRDAIPHLEAWKALEQD